MPGLVRSMKVKEKTQKWGRWEGELEVRREGRPIPVGDLGPGN